MFEESKDIIPFTINCCYKQDLYWENIVTFNSLCMKFIWHGQNPHVALRTLQCLKRLGGLAVSSLRKYYEEIALQWILDWHHHVNTKLCVSPEKFLTWPTPPDFGGLSDFTSPFTDHLL